MCNYVEPRTVGKTVVLGAEACRSEGSRKRVFVPEVRDSRALRPSAPSWITEFKGRAPNGDIVIVPVGTVFDVIEG